MSIQQNRTLAMRAKDWKNMLALGDKVRARLAEAVNFLNYRIFYRVRKAKKEIEVLRIYDVRRDLRGLRRR